MWLGLLHRDRNTTGGPNIQLQAFGSRLQTHDHAIFIFESQPTYAAAQRNTYVQLGIGTGEFGNILQIIHLAGRAHL